MARINERTQSDPAVWASMMAAKFAQAIKLEPGNRWECAIARYLERECRAGTDRTTLEMQLALQIGLHQSR